MPSPDGVVPCADSILWVPLFLLFFFLLTLNLFADLSELKGCVPVAVCVGPVDKCQLFLELPDAWKWHQ